MTDHEFKAPKRTTTEPSDETTARLAEIRDRANAAAIGANGATTAPSSPHSCATTRPSAPTDPRRACEF